MTSRIRKAYAVRIVGYDYPYEIYAPNGSKARARVIANLRDAWGWTFREALRNVAGAYRHSYRDVHLPPRHPLATTLSKRVLDCVVHAYGGTGLRAGYRDYFYAGADDWVMQAALYHGLFRVYRVDKGRDGRPDMIMYELTDLGRNVAAGEVKTYPECD